VESHPYVAEAHAQLARLHGAHTRSGRDHGEAALHLARRLGMKPLAEDVGAWLHPGTLSPALTLRENEITALVAEGLTNAGIAAHLHAVAADGGEPRQSNPAQARLGNAYCPGHLESGTVPREP
jgi:hypothetical protein